MISLKVKLISILGRYQLFILPSAGVLISLGIALFVILPQIFGIFETDRNILETEKRIASLEKKAAELQTISLPEYKEKFASLVVVLPPEPEVLSAVSLLQGLAAQNGFKISRISLNLGGNASASNNYSATLDIGGEISSINLFINSLRNAPRVVTINKVDLSSDKVSGLYFATLSINVYYQKQKTTLSSLEQEISLLNDQEKESLNKIVSSVKIVTPPSSTPGSTTSEPVTGEVGKSNPFE